MNISETYQDVNAVKVQKNELANGDSEIHKLMDNVIKLPSDQEDSSDYRNNSESELMELSDCDDEAKYDFKSESEDSLEGDICQKEVCESLLTIDGTSLSASGDLNDLSLNNGHHESGSSVNNSAVCEHGGISVEETAADSISYVERVISSNDNHSESMNGVIPKQSNLHSSKAFDKIFVDEKMSKILNALQRNDRSYLQKAAISRGGLLSDDIRRKVWPQLVGVDLVETSPRPCQDEIEQHPYYQQVILDVNRSLKRFPPSIREAQRLTMLDQLVLLIMRVLCKHPELHYYQGYHDICVTFLLVLGEETAYHVVEKLSQTHLRVFMEKSMDPTIHLLENMYLLIGKKHPKFQEFLLKSEVGVAYCLSWLITWFSHVLNDYSTVVRMFDFFIVSDPWMPMYVTASLVLYREMEVTKQDCDMASVHSCLSKIPDDLPFEHLLTEALDLFECYKPKAIAQERPYIQKVRRRKLKRWNFNPRKYVSTSLVIAAAVVVTAVIYQAFNY